MTHLHVGFQNDGVMDKRSMAGGGVKSSITKPGTKVVNGILA